MNKWTKSAVVLAALGTSFFSVVFIMGLNLELRESNIRLRDTVEVLEKIKVDLSSAEEDLEKAEKRNLELMLFVVELIKEKEGRVLVEKNGLAWLLNCCQVTIDAGGIPRGRR